MEVYGKTHIHKLTDVLVKMLWHKPIKTRKLNQRRGQVSRAKEMDDTLAEFIKRTILKIPMTEMMTVLKAWDFLSEKQLQTVNFRQRKEPLVHDLVLLCEVTVSFRDAEENSVWIRIAWGTQYRKPNQYKPVYVVYYSQTPYVFTSCCQLKSNIPLLGQALTVASNHHKIVKMDLRSRYLDSLKAIVFKQYNQLETKFKSDFNGDILAERKEPLRCLIKFSSPHLLEALKALAPAGIADAPLSPLLTCIPNKGMNYFKIRDK
ncbi:hypothetical protein GH733_012915 [Mirounga leonina]|nr:hypothetical protein GH733_012915 [Mirounga leonina]